MSEPLTKEKIGLDRISPSKLECYETCPRLFYYRDWLGLKLDDYKLHMDFGTAIHETLEYLYLLYDDNFGGAWEGQEFADVEKRFNERWKLRMVPQSAFDIWIETSAGRKSGYTKREELYEHFKKDGIIMLQSYWDNKERMIADYNHDLSTFELYKRIEMKNPTDETDKLPIPLSMRLDAMNRDETKIIDFKTSGSKYDEAESRKKIQGQCYLFAHLMEHGEMIKKFDYIVLRKNLKTPDRIQVVELEYDEADMLSFYIRVKSILTKIANREFDIPKVGHMPYCQCKDYEEALSVEGIELAKKD